MCAGTGVKGVYVNVYLRLNRARIHIGCVDGRLAVNKHLDQPSNPCPRTVTVRIGAPTMTVDGPSAEIERLGVPPPPPVPPPPVPPVEPVLLPPPPQPDRTRASISNGKQNR